MNSAVQIICEIESASASVAMEGEQLKLVRGKLLSTSLLDLVRANKAEVIEVLTRNKNAKEEGFLSLVSGEVYERQYSPTSHVFIIMESNYWNAHRETWQQGKKDSASYNQIVKRVSFDMALLKARQYIEYFKGGKKH